MAGVAEFDALPFQEIDLLAQLVHALHAKSRMSHAVRGAQFRTARCKSDLVVLSRILAHEDDFETPPRYLSTICHLKAQYTSVEIQHLFGVVHINDNGNGDDKLFGNEGNIKITL